MRFGAVLSVKDEVELIEPAIRHLRMIGVDHIIACDMESSDGTYELLGRYRSDTDFWLFRLSDREDDHFEAWCRVTVALAKSARLDWVIFQDADEFWLPATGRLRDCQALYRSDVFIVPRFNVLPTVDMAIPADGFGANSYADLMLSTNTIPNLQAVIDVDPSVVWIQAAVEPKIMARPDRIRSVELGSHDVLPGDSAELVYREPADLAIAHLPITDRERFHRRIDNIREVFRVHGGFFGDRVAWHWRRWLRLADEGRLDEEFDRQVADAAAIEQLRRRGVAKSAQAYFDAG